MRILSWFLAFLAGDDSVVFLAVAGVRVQRSADDGQLHAESDSDVRNDARPARIHARREAHGRQIHRHTRTISITSPSDFIEPHSGPAQRKTLGTD